MFGPDGYSTGFQDSKYIKWDRSPINSDDDVIFITECNLHEINNISSDKITYAWFLESPEIRNCSYDFVKNINKKYTYVLTHSKELLDAGENYKFCPAGGCWILLEDQKIHMKNKILSIISSGKDWTTGHKLRHRVIFAFKDRMDVFGNGYKTIDNKLIGLKDYAFSLAIENTKQDYYFSEKLIDCFMTGTVPIYWGCPSIEKFFNTDGMILFDSINDLPKIIYELSLEKYNTMKSAIEYNFQKAKDYIISEDYIYKNYLM